MLLDLHQLLRLVVLLLHHLSGIITIIWFSLFCLSRIVLMINTIAYDIFTLRLIQGGLHIMVIESALYNTNKAC